MYTTHIHLTEHHELPQHLSLCAFSLLYSLTSSSFSSPHLFDSVFCVHFLPAFVCFSLSLSLSQQIWFITFLMLFGIAWHSQRLKSKSFFQSVRLVCKYCTKHVFFFFLIHTDCKHLLSLELTLDARCWTTARDYSVLRKIIQSLCGFYLLRIFFKCYVLKHCILCFRYVQFMRLFIIISFMTIQPFYS